MVANQGADGFGGVERVAEVGHAFPLLGRVAETLATADADPVGDRRAAAGGWQQRAFDETELPQAA